MSFFPKVSKWRERVGAETISTRVRLREPLIYSAFFVLVALLVVILLGLHALSDYHAQVAYWNAQNSSIADDQVNLILNWAEERYGDTQVLAGSSRVRAALESRGNPGRSASRDTITSELTGTLDDVVNSYSYSAAYIVNRDGQVVVRSTHADPFGPSFTAGALSSMSTGEVKVTTVGDKFDDASLAFARPVGSAPNSTTTGSLGAVVLVARVAQTIFPMITRGTSSTGSGETLLIRRRGVDLTFFSPLRFRPRALPFLTVPVAQASVAEQSAVEGKRESTDSIDYRGEKVFASTAFVPLLNWGVIRKIDRREALASFYTQTMWEIITAALFLTVVGGLLVFHRRHLVARAAKKEGERFRMLFETAPDAIYLLDPSNYRILSRNRIASRVDGLSDEEARRTAMPELYLGEEQASVRNIFSRSLNSDVSHPVISTFHLVRKDQRTVSVELSCSLVKTETEKVILAILHDTTEQMRALDALRQSELRYRTVFQTSPHGIALSHVESATIVEINQAFSEITLYEPDEVIGKGTRDLGLWEDWNERENLLRSLKQEGTVRGYQGRFRRKDGEIRWGQLSASLVEVGGQNYIYAALRDITAQKQLEEQFLQAQKMEAVGRLAGGVAHDFNNILSVIMGHAELLLAKCEDSQSVRRLGEIKTAVNRAAEVTRHLLTFSRKHVYESREIELNKVIRDVTQMLGRILGDNIRLVSSLEPDLDIVKVNSVGIEQVLLNLVVNARDAMPNGGTLVIETSNVLLDADAAKTINLRPASYVRLSVRDTGMGMSPETQTRIFEPFFTTKAHNQGTGLGLSTVLGIVQQSGGGIAVFSEVGRGTAFDVYLPALNSSDLSEKRSRKFEVKSAAEVDDVAKLRGVTLNLLKGLEADMVPSGGESEPMQIVQREPGALD